MDGELRLVNMDVDQTDPLAKLKVEAPEGQVVLGGVLQNTSMCFALRASHKTAVQIRS